jgi:Ser/Thr protein kinase RdoA (MazF antagonist)
MEERLAEVCAAFGLGELRSAEYLPIGLLNRNWRAETDAGTVAVKLFRDIDADQARDQHRLLRVLAGHGLPIPLPRAAPGGDTVWTSGEQSFAVFAWVDGVHRGGMELSLDQCRELGALLGRSQVALARSLPVPAERVPIPVDDPVQTIGYIDKLLALIDDRPEPDEIDAIARANLTWRRGVLPELSGLRPAGDELGPWGWTHGDFHHNNVLWRDGRVAGVLDWDRYRVQPVAAELVRSCLLIFNDGGGVLDLVRVRAFVSAYRSHQDLKDEQIADAAHRMWWLWLTGFWPLNVRYERNDTSFDHLFVRNERLTRWWTAHRDEVAAAFSAQER